MSVAFLGTPSAEAQQVGSFLAAFQASDAELNRLYRQGLAASRQATMFVRTLRQSQRAWLAYGDAHLSALYPSNPGSYGTSYPICRAQALTALTDERIAVLRRWIAGMPSRWIAGTPRGDVCTDSSRRISAPE
ncbi:MAG TPA: lysozyme inhibitor LprI family protein [Gemmatimonadales bacterium]|nr:lysozyme inhibitor LprI family protein [Gemmatimonadales bacterium]